MCGAKLQVNYHSGRLLPSWSFLSNLRHHQHAGNSQTALFSFQTRRPIWRRVHCSSLPPSLSLSLYLSLALSLPLSLRISLPLSLSALPTPKSGLKVETWKIAIRSLGLEIGRASSTMKHFVSKNIPPVRPAGWLAGRPISGRCRRRRRLERQRIPSRGGGKMAVQNWMSSRCPLSLE